ncbi:MAG: carboxypeptidase-like regulatory domain-containing protein [Flavobacteriales bacterium]
MSFKKILLTTILFSSFIGISQTGKLTGTVTEKNGEPIPFANVFVVGATKGSTTNLEGKYKLDLEPGTHKVVYTFVGFNADTINVTIKPGETVKKDVILLEKENLLKVFNVSAIKVTNTEAAVIKEVMESKQVVNAISAETIEKTGDSDASEVVKRVPGVTVVGNNFIMIRGLSERYNNVLLHDVFAPSMETDVKSFAFDIIPAGMIDRILIYKSPAPDVTGEFAGGVVKIYTKSIPDSNSTSVSLSTTYRQGTSFQNFLQPARGKWHWTGFNDGYNNLPAGFPADIRRIDANDIGRLDDVGQSLKNNWLPEQVNSLMDKSFSFTHAKRMQWKDIKIGNITSLSYSNSRTLFNSERNDYNVYDTINDRSQFIYSFNDQQFNQNIRTGLLHNWAFKLNENNMIEFKNMFNVFSTTQYVNRTGYDYEFNYSPNNHSFDQIYRGLYSGQLMGTHTLNEDLTKIYWTTGFGFSYRDEPDYRRYRTEIDTNSGEQQLFVGIPLSPNYLGRFFSEMRENSQSASFRVEHTMNGKKMQPILKTGIFFERKYRDFKARNIGYVRGNFMGFDENLLYGTIDELFQPENINQTTGIKIGEATNPSDSYNASNLLTAGYVGAELPFTDKINLNTGIRTEYNIQELFSRSLTGDPIIVNNPILSILPSANLTYFFKKDTTLIRLAYGQSVNRPEFRELAPFGFYDFNFNMVKKGSDSLRTPAIHNFDLRLEKYPRRGEMLSVALFYKKFINPIETLFVPGGGSGGIKTFTFGNAKEAYSAGIEVEAIKSFEGILKNSTLLDNFSLMFNASIIRSRVELGQAQLGQSNIRPLQGQSPYIVNTGIFYKNEKHKYSVNVLYNVIGERIFIIGFDAYPDIYEMPRNVIDINIAKTFKKGWEAKLAFGDIMNQEVLLIQDANANGKFERNGDQIIQRYTPGMTVSFGLGYKF